MYNTYTYGFKVIILKFRNFLRGRFEIITVGYISQLIRDQLSKKSKLGVYSFKCRP